MGLVWNSGYGQTPGQVSITNFPREGTITILPRGTSVTFPDNAINFPLDYAHDPRSVPVSLIELHGTGCEGNPFAFRAAEADDQWYLRILGITGAKLKSVVAVKGDNQRSVDMIQRSYEAPFRFETRQTGITWGLWLPSDGRWAIVPTAEQIASFLQPTFHRELYLLNGALFENIRFCESALPMKFDDATFHIAAKESGVLIWRRKGADNYEGAGSFPLAPWTSILANADWFFHAGKPK